MRRWKTVVVAGAAIAIVAGAGTVANRVEGRERHEQREPLVRAFALSDAFGSRIGVTVREADEKAVSKDKGMTVGSVIIEDVRENSPADEAGIREGDVVLEWDGERVRSARQFRRLVSETARGRETPVALSRDGKRVDLKVTPEDREVDDLGERWRGLVTPGMPAMEWERFVPEIEIYSSRRARLGVQIDDLTDQLAEYFGVSGGVLLTSVEEHSAAAKAGLKAGDIITRVDGATIRDTRDLRDELRRIDDDREFSIEVSRDRKPLTLKARMEPRRSSSTRRETRTERF